MTWFSESRPWRSGLWSLERRDDEFADISYRDRLVLRSVRAVVRDRNWDTARLVVDRVRDSGATLTLYVRSEGLGSSFRGVVRVEARGTRLLVIADLESTDEFTTNRTGIVVLHPPRLAGEPLHVRHSDGTVEATSFPRAISPHQPVVDIAALSWRYAGVDVATYFEGDVFEMEDQRNWSDASYKTYSRPLALPFPYDIAPGERVRQSVWIDVREVDDTRPDSEPDLIRLEIGGPVFELAVGASTAPDPAPAPSSLRPPAVLVELDLRTPNWRAALTRAAVSGARLDVRVIASADAPFDDLASALAGVAVKPGIARIGVFEADLQVTDAAVLAAMRRALDAADLRLSIIGGSRAHFTELNREQESVPRDIDGVAFSTTPLFHSLGTEQLVESVAMQRSIALQAVELSDGLPVHVGPVTLRPRFNDAATTPQPLPTRGDLAAGYGAEFTGASDPRQSAEELAAWTLASAAALAVPGVASLAFFEEWGERGIRTSAGEPYPVASAIEALADLCASGGRMLWGASPDGLVWAIGARTDEGDVALVSNLDRTTRHVTVTTDDAETTASIPAFGWLRHEL